MLPRTRVFGDFFDAKGQGTVSQLLLHSEITGGVRNRGQTGIFPDSLRSEYREYPACPSITIENQFTFCFNIAEVAGLMLLSPAYWALI